MGGEGTRFGKTFVVGRGFWGRNGSEGCFSFLWVWVWVWVCVGGREG
jgi:hypothetical protein